MKKVFILIPLTLFTLLLSACQTKTYDIVVTLFPQYDMVRTIVGEKNLTYRMLLAPGVEIHAFEPSSKQIGTIQSSKLFIYTSNELETWASNLANKGTVVNLEEAITRDHEAHDIHGDTHDDEHTHDVHYWVSINQQIHMVESILDLIIELDPDNETYYESNAASLIESLESIRTQFMTLSSYESEPVFFIGHNVFSLLNEDFGLDIHSLTDSYSPESDPTSAQIGQMMMDIVDANASYIYFDPFENNTIAKTIKTDLQSAHNYSVELKPLYTMHNLSKTQYNDGITLLDLWLLNFTNIELTYGSGS